MKTVLAYWKTALLTVALAVTGIGMTACNTTEGVGRDVQAVGEGVEEGAQETNPDRRYD
ncbi:MAG: entericidin A/B family lipoprotein [Phycisphaeraceae bacterium]